MAQDNGVSIANAGSGNTINIHQQQAPGSPHIEYAVDAQTVERLPQAQVQGGLLAFFGSILLPILAVVADGLGVLSYAGIQTKWAMLATLAAAAVGVVLSNPLRKIATAALSPGRAAFVDGSWVERDADGDYVRYRRAAPCTYPKCSGTVSIEPAPERERPNHALVGVCSIGGPRHTYTVDFNGIGFPHQFDWRPAPAQKA